MSKAGEWGVEWLLELVEAMALVKVRVGRRVDGAVFEAASSDVA